MLAVTVREASTILHASCQINDKERSNIWRTKKLRGFLNKVEIKESGGKEDLIAFTRGGTAGLLINYQDFKQ